MQTSILGVKYKIVVKNITFGLIRMKDSLERGPQGTRHQNDVITLGLPQSCPLRSRTQQFSKRMGFAQASNRTLDYLPRTQTADFKVR